MERHDLSTPDRHAGLPRVRPRTDRNPVALRPLHEHAEEVVLPPAGRAAGAGALDVGVVAVRARHHTQDAVLHVGDEVDCGGGRVAGVAPRRAAALAPRLGGAGVAAAVVEVEARQVLMMVEGVCAAAHTVGFGLG